MSDPAFFWIDSQSFAEKAPMVFALSRVNGVCGNICRYYEYAALVAADIQSVSLTYGVILDSDMLSYYFTVFRSVADRGEVIFKFTFQYPGVIIPEYFHHITFLLLQVLL